MNPRVVVIAEGANEIPPGAWRAEPGDWLPPDTHHGAAHALVARCVEAACGIPVAAVQFEEPLLHRSRRVRGSQLVTVLPKLLRWPPGRGPSLAVVFVDEDGDPDRAPALEALADSVSTPTAIGVAVREFESWLIADAARTSALLGASPPAGVEDLDPGWAKSWLDSVIADPAKRSSLRHDLARALHLPELRERSASFVRFEHRLARCLHEAGFGRSRPS